MATQQIVPAEQMPPNTQLATVDSKPPEVHKFELQQRAAKLFAMSGLFSDIKGQSLEQSIAQAFVKINLGESMGLNAAESMTGIDIIQGRVAVSAGIRASRMQRSGYSWDVLQLNEQGCKLRIKYGGKELGEASFSAADAQRAGLSGKDNYKKYPPDMLFARTITRAQRWYAPGVLGLNILSTEEVRDGGLIVDNPGDGIKVATDAKLDELKRKYVEKQEPPVIEATIVEAAPEEASAS